MARFGDFVVASPTSYHAAAETARRLEAAGFVAQDQTQAFSAVPGKYYIVRDGACIAWRIPQNVSLTSGFRIVGSHTDSPSFKLKPNPNHLSAGWNQIGVEVYGGVLANSWLNRDLALAGRLVTISGEVKLVQTDPIAVIAQLAPHLDRTDTLQLNRQEHLMPIVAAGIEDFDVLDLLCCQAGIVRDELASYDIFAIDTQPPAFVGADKKMFASGRIDNLSSVFCSLEAIKAADSGTAIQVLAAFDHEEVGSATRTGAAGSLLEEVLRRICVALGGDMAAFQQMLVDSSCISADAAHAVNPNYVGKHDPDTRPAFNKGAVLKLNGNQRYATDAIGAAIWLRACRAAGVPSQEFVGNNSVPCGSTIGPITATRLGIRTIDVGIPMLSMHSIRELCGSDDMEYLTKALVAYLNDAK